MKWMLVLGAESDIAKAVVRRFASEGVNYYLAHFNVKEIEDFANDVAIRNNVQAIPVVFDAVKYSTHINFYNKLAPKPDGAICIFGYLGDNKKGMEDFNEAEHIFDVNFKGAVSILNIIAYDFLKKKKRVDCSNIFCSR